MKAFKHQPITRYLDQLSSRTPVPGGGSAAALVGALGVSLILMVARYSQGRSKSQGVEKKLGVTIKDAEKIRKRLTDLIDRDAKAYLQVVKARGASLQKRRAARRKARQVPAEVCRLSYAALKLTPFLVLKGNPYLLSDVRCAIEMLYAAFQSAVTNIDANP